MKRKSVVRRVQAAIRGVGSYSKATSQGRANRKQAAGLAQYARKHEPIKAALKRSAELGVKVNLADYKKPLKNP